MPWFTFANNIEMIFDPTTTLIVTGDTNHGKTTFINNLTGCDFYTESGNNKTKILTIFHHKSENYGSVIVPLTDYPIDVKNASFTFESLDQLTTWYNTESTRVGITRDFICHVFLKGGDNVNIVDTIGKSDQFNSEDHNRTMERIKKLYPNNINVNLIKLVPTRNLDYSESINVITFADLINFETDPTSEDTYNNFIDEFRSQRLLFFSNKNDQSQITIKNTTIKVYGKDNVSDVADIAFELSNLYTTVTPLEDIYTDQQLNDAQCVTKFMDGLIKYNNLELYNEVNNFVRENDLPPLDAMMRSQEEIIKDRQSKQRPGVGPHRLIEIIKSHTINTKWDKWTRAIISEQCRKREEQTLSQTKGKDFSEFDRIVREQIITQSTEFVSWLKSIVFSKCMEIIKSNAIKQQTKRSELDTPFEDDIECKKRKLI